jgi:hypothetical protein
MAKSELMWVCALLPQGWQERWTALCRAENQQIGLPEDVFRFPLHISLKKSFVTTQFDAVQEQVLQYIRQRGPLTCRILDVKCRKQMLWLPVEAAGQILDWHNGLDQLLLERFQIPIDPFDAEFEPHISLFTRGEASQMEEMQRKLSERIPPQNLTLDRFVVGSSVHGDLIFTI